MAKDDDQQPAAAEEPHHQQPAAADDGEDGKDGEDGWPCFTFAEKRGSADDGDDGEDGEADEDSNADSEATVHEFPSVAVDMDPHAKKLKTEKCDASSSGASRSSSTF